ncbi:MAG: hypothetical protein KGK01_00225 [Bradyrhizobium sp.]|uniref:hypothetical protein n=1 Tax=Bradyrhizobium sp. TaxID=376 RepID=UPI001C297A59|nr:hypothetical protein [Bradyrhizobium sp.]MBU6462176.1 hypothetical protein [Pseudomonadota bacterium]MDE2067177.1 hypothetical protein [Bradyrhizobium sp.]MDE2240900.1 hypothetical protein [Bradyrhizobium sp.]MDE2470076.1 hypothetical protein [Bradyrhizobium sp.]
MVRFITRPATKLVADHDKYADHHTLTERAADRERRVLSMKAREGLPADDRKILGEAAIESRRFMQTKCNDLAAQSRSAVKTAGVAIAADSGREPIRKVE